MTPNVIHVVHDTSQAGGQGIETFEHLGQPHRHPERRDPVPRAFARLPLCPRAGPISANGVPW